MTYICFRFIIKWIRDFIFNLVTHCVDLARFLKVYAVMSSILLPTVCRDCLLGEEGGVCR